MTDTTTPSPPSPPPPPPSQKPLQNEPSPPTKPSARLSALRAKHLSLQTTLDNLTSERDTLASRTLSATFSQTTTTTSSSISPTDFPSSQQDHADIRARAAVDIAIQKSKSHIRQLQQYNDVKDIGQQLMGLIAEKRGVRIVQVQREFGVEGHD